MLRAEQLRRILPLERFAPAIQPLREILTESSVRQPSLLQEHHESAAIYYAHSTTLMSAPSSAGGHHARRPPDARRPDAGSQGSPRRLAAAHQHATEKGYSLEIFYTKSTGLPGHGRRTLVAVILPVGALVSSRLLMPVCHWP